MKNSGKTLMEKANLILEQDPKLPKMFSLTKLHEAGHPMWPVVSLVNSTLAKSGTLIDNVVEPVVAEGWQYLDNSTSSVMY